MCNLLICIGVNNNSIFILRKSYLNQELPNVGDFDVIFLRNVLIYFNEETKRGVIDRLQTKLRPGGWFFVGHSESLNGVNPALESYGYSVYRKRVPGAPPAPPPKRRHT